MSRASRGHGSGILAITQLRISRIRFTVLQPGMYDVTLTVARGDGAWKTMTEFDVLDTRQAAESQRWRYHPHRKHKKRFFFILRINRQQLFRDREW